MNNFMVVYSPTEATSTIHFSQTWSVISPPFRWTDFEVMELVREVNDMEVGLRILDNLQW